jgi:FAR1 DNA-binding domain
VKPDVADEFKPNSNMRFKCYEDAIAMYRIYAEKAGFDVRLYSQRVIAGILRHKYVVCNRNGTGPDKSADSICQRKVSYKVTECTAKIIIKVIPSTGEYYIQKFCEMHNHPLQDIRDLRSSRQLTLSEKEFIVRASTVKMGPSIAHKLRATLMGGYAYMTAKEVDYKNFKRNSGKVIGVKDAQMIIDKMNTRKANYSNYFFEYKYDENKVLNAMFWADETERAYFTEFGDVVSFDATFRTNK